MSVSADQIFPDGLTEENLLNQALLGETAVDGARHGIAPHAPHALQASPHASPAPHAHAPHAGVQLDVRAHAPCTHAQSPHGMLTTQAVGPPHALQPFGQPAFGQLSVLAESAPLGASPNEVILGRHAPSPSASMHHDASMPSPISQYSPRSNACRPLVVRDAQSELKTFHREFDEMKIVVEKLSSDVDERFRLLSSEKLEEIVAPRLDTAIKIMMHELECFDRRTSERIDSVATRCRESREDVSDRMRIRMTEHDESIGAIFAANSKLATCIDVHIEEFQKELYHSLERTKSSEEMRDSQLRDLMKRFNEYVAPQNVRMQKFAVDSVALQLRREIEARVSNPRPASEPTKHPQFFDMARDDGMFSHTHPHRDHVPDVADLRDVASDQGGPLFPHGIVEHVPPGSLLIPVQRRPEHGGCVAAPAPLASTVGGSETDVNSVFAAAVSARSRNEADLHFMSSLPQKSSLYEQYMRTLEEVKGGPVLERRSDVPSASQAAPAPSSSFVCERTAPNLQFPAPIVPGMPLKPSAAHDPAPTGCVGTFPCQVRYDPRAAPTRAKASRWVESMLGRSHFNPPTSVQESIAAASAQTHVTHESLRHIPPPQVIPPLPTPGIQHHQSQYHAGYLPGERVDGSGQDGGTGVPNTSGTGSANPIHPPAGPPPPSGAVEMVGDTFRVKVTQAVEPDLLAVAAVAMAHLINLVESR